jgi:hypothetical protein
MTEYSIPDSKNGMTLFCIWADNRIILFFFGSRVQSGFVQCLFEECKLREEFHFSCLNSMVNQKIVMTKVTSANRGDNQLLYKIWSWWVTFQYPWLLSKLSKFHEENYISTTSNRGQNPPFQGHPLHALLFDQSMVPGNRAIDCLLIGRITN